MRLFRRRRPAAPSPLAEQQATVRLMAVHTTAVLHTVADELAEAFAAHPGQATALLLAHADAWFRLEAAVLDSYSAEHERAMYAAEADGTRAALLGLSPAAADLMTHTRTTLENDR